MVDDKLQELVQQEDAAGIAQVFFNTDISQQTKQQEIVRTIAFEKHRRNIITALTRYGKTFSVALGTAMYFLLHKGRTVNEIAPVQKQGKKFRQYFVDFVLASPLKNLLDVNARGAERIKKEVSKQRITFKDGNELNILTAGGKNTAESLMGHGGDLIILDESCDIPDEVYRKRISRQLGDNPDSILVEIGNPWRKDNHFYKHWTEQNRFNKIRIDWKQALKEGRITKGFVEEQRNELTDTEFQVLYEARFPDSVENGMFQHSWVEQAKDQSFEFEDDQKVVGVDVGEHGKDSSVACFGYIEGNRAKVSKFEEWRDVDVTEVASQLDEQHLLGHEILNVDAIGVGSGCASRLKELNYEAFAVKVSKKPRRRGDRFLNRKAEFYWRLRALFKEGLIDLPEDVPNRLINELTSIRYELTSSGKIKIVDPDKSPDFADALMLMVCRRVGSGSVAGGKI